MSDLDPVYQALFGYLFQQLEPDNQEYVEPNSGDNDDDGEEDESEEHY